MKVSHVISEKNLLGKQKYQTGRPAQVKGKGPLPKKEPGRTKHPFHGKLVDDMQINEAFPALIPALITAIRVGGPPLLKWLGRKGAAGAARGTVGAGRMAVRHPVATTVFATGYAGYEYLKDLIPDLPEELLEIMVKYSIPAAVVLGLIYGGKKLYDFLRNKEQTATTESINQNLAAFLKETATAGGTSSGGMASTGTGFASGGIGERPKKKKKTNLVRR